METLRRPVILLIDGRLSGIPRAIGGRISDMLVVDTENIPSNSELVAPLKIHTGDQRFHVGTRRFWATTIAFRSPFVCSTRDLPCSVDNTLYPVDESSVRNAANGERFSCCCGWANRCGVGSFLRPQASVRRLKVVRNTGSAIECCMREVTKEPSF